MMTSNILSPLTEMNAVLTKTNAELTKMNVELTKMNAEFTKMNSRPMKQIQLPTDTSINSLNTSPTPKAGLHTQNHAKDNIPTPSSPSAWRHSKCLKPKTLTGPAKKLFPVMSHAHDLDHISKITTTNS
jgi:hypothetical protein